MSYKVHPCPSFDRCIRRFKKRFPHVKDDVHTAIKLLTKRPKTGSVIPRSSGLRKLRIPNTDQARGKSGGYRLIYHIRDTPTSTIYLLLLYTKSDQSDVTIQKIKQLLRELQDEVEKSNT